MPIPNDHTGKESWVGKFIHTDKTVEESTDDWARRNNQEGGASRTSTKWRGRLPICPYGCGEQGQLQEIVMLDNGSVVGLFKDSESLIFQAPMQMQDDDSRKVKLSKSIDGEVNLGG